MGIRFVDGYPVAMSLVRRASPSVSRCAALPRVPLMKLLLDVSFCLPLCVVRHYIY